MDTHLTTAFGTFQLSRNTEIVSGRQQSLRAWDAADEYILQYLSENTLAADCVIHIYNDAFGALLLSLNQYNVISISDSFVSQQASKKNMSNNLIDMSSVNFINSLEALENKADVILLKIPKTLAMLEHQLYQIRDSIKPSTLLIAAAMSKCIHTSTLQLFESVIGETSTSLAKKKARLIFCKPDTSRWQGQSPFPDSYQLENTPYQLINHANVFSRQRLDIGTRFLLPHIPTCDEKQTIIDLACGNGVVGLIAAERNKNATLVFIDESYMAIASAKHNFQSTHAQRQAIYHVTNGLQGIEENSADWIICNPPFHQDNVVGDFIAKQMFQSAKAVLKRNGKLLVVANRHLHYYAYLKKLFGHCETLDANKKFVVLQSSKLLPSKR